MRRLAPVWLAAAAAIPAFAASRTAPATAPRAPLGPETPLARAYLDRLARYTRYALPQVRDWPGAAGCRYHKRDGHRELDVRQNASVALAFAVLARYGEGVSIPRDDVARDARGIIRYLAATHRTGTLPAGDGEPWGDAWQSAFWAGLAGHAAWIIWEDLDDETRIRAARMVAHEADRFLDRPPDDGFRGDTKAEENAWNSIALALAACMFPDDPLAARRRERAIVYMMNAFSEPGDRTDATIVDGRPVRAWVTTTCLYPDHTLENHGRVHPDYLTTFSLNLRNALLYRMAGLDVPRAAFHHAGDAFGVLKRLASPSGGLFYINGQDWWPHRNELALVTGAFMSVLAGDREGAFLERSSLDRLGLLHSRFEDGRLWDPREYNYSEGEEEMMARYAELYLLHRLFGDGPEPVSEAAFESAQGGIRIFEVGGFAIDRTADRLASFAWRNGAMGLVYPGGDTWFTAPWERGIVGRIEVEGAKDDAPAVRSHAARADAGALVVSADIGRCEGRVRQSIAFVALPEGPVIAIERLAAASPCVLRRALTGSLGILNEPAGAVHGNARTIAHEGARFTVTGACDDPDREIPIASRWVLIDDRFGVIALGGERMLYVDANRFERARLREELHASAVAGPRRLAAGEVFRDGATVILSGVDGARIRAALDAWRFERAGEDAARIRGPGWTIDVRYGEGAPAVSIGRGGDGGAEVRIEKLWEGRQRIEGRPVGAGALVLLPCGLHLVALDARTGDEVWRYPFEEDRAGLLVPMGIQGVGYAPLRQGRGIAIAIGSTEIHGIGSTSGRRIWTHQEKRSCTLALNLVRDLDGDRVPDAVSCGCNDIVCVSGAQGNTLWSFPISGRSWWAADAGDLDADGIPDALVHASGAVQAVRVLAGGGTAVLWSAPVIVQPLRAFSIERDIALLYPTGLIERRAGRSGRLVWSATLDAARGALLDAALAADGSALYVLAEKVLARIAAGDGKGTQIARAPARAGCLSPADGLAFIEVEAGEIAALDLATGRERGRGRLSGGAIADMIVLDGAARGIGIAVTAGGVAGWRFDGEART